ncbi:MAG: methyltransferase domain-containing protein [Porticoccaceae bacterium]
MENKANADMDAYWNGEGGDKWVSFGDRLEASLKPFGVRTIAAAALRGDENVLEVGCGCGPNTIDLAKKLSGGQVRGLDISATVLEKARQDAVANKLSNISFDCVDAQTGDLGVSQYDLAFSRFGVMFFDDPVCAFKNINRALKSDGRIIFACWAAPGKNPWVAEPLALVAKHVPLPPPPEPGTPGPFSLSDEARLRDLLAEAGFINIAVETFQAPMVLGDGVAEAVEFLMNMAPSGGAVNRADPDAATRAAIATDLGDMLKSRQGAKGVIMDAAALIVTADKG